MGHGMLLENSSYFSIIGGHLDKEMRQRRPVAMTFPLAMTLDSKKHVTCMGRGRGGGEV